MNNNKNLTLIIPSFNRPNKLKNSIEYWSKSPFQILILDGSDVRHSSAKKGLSKNIKYYHLKKPLEKRLKFGASKIKTKFSALISEDELLSAIFLKEAAKVMTKNPKISAVIGDTIAFKKENNMLLFKKEYESASRLNIFSPNSVKRLEARLKILGNSIFYCATRSAVMQKALNLIGEKKYSCPFIPEYQFESALCAGGQIKYIPKIMWYRNRGSGMVSDFNYNRNINLNRWIKKIAKRHEISYLAGSFRKIFFSISRNKIDGYKIIKMFLEFEQKSSRPTNIKRFCILLNNWLPKKIINKFSVIKSLFSKLFWGWKTEQVFLNKIDSLYPEKYKKEFSKTIYFLSKA